MTQLYRCEVTIYATAYVRADSIEEAAHKAAALSDTAIELPPGELYGVSVSDACFGDPELPTVSLSPHMTLGPITSIPEQVDD